MLAACVPQRVHEMGHADDEIDTEALQKYVDEKYGARAYTPIGGLSGRGFWGMQVGLAGEK